VANDPLRPLERDVLDLLLAGDHPALHVLRAQRRTITVKGRVFTGSGFLSDLEVTPGVPRLPDTLSTFISDVGGEQGGLRCGFIVHIRAGLLDVLEGHVWGELDWPGTASGWRLFYEAPERDLMALRLPTT
jgi:hypothetical protein